MASHMLGVSLRARSDTDQVRHNSSNANINSNNNDIMIL